MKRAAVLVLVLAALAGCSRSDDERTDIIDVDGVQCAVARDNWGRIKALSCDWEGE
jgi:hypothetical protein